MGWTLAVVVTGGTLGAGLLARRRRLSAGLEPPPLAGIVLRTVLVGAAMFIGVAILLSAAEAVQATQADIAARADLPG